MKLGLNTGYWSAGPPAGVVDQIAEAERLGFDSMWTAEAYGSDALTPLAWWGASTTTMRLGTAIMQMSARTPTAAAMAALTMDHLSGGRFILGLGASGPQVVEGWYGQAYPKPLARTREYIDIVRQVIAREAPVEFAGEHYQLPFPGGAGLGCADFLRPMLALYIGGMGAKGANFHYEVFARMGYEAECARIQELYLDGNKRDAIAAVPTSLVEDVALIGPLAKVTEEASVWKDTVISTALVTGDASQFAMIHELLG